MATYLTAMTYFTEVYMRHKMYTAYEGGTKYYTDS